MKKLQSIVLLLAMVACVFSSCDIESPYSTTGCPISFTISDLMGTQMMVSAHPERDDVFYYFDIMPKAQYEQMNLPDAHFMGIVLDSLYRSYLDWRSPYLLEGEMYLCEFRAFAFHYGDAQRHFTSLQPNTDYIIYGMCINPEDVQWPIGELYKQPVRTGEVDYSVSQTVFDFAVKMYDKPTMFDGVESQLSATIRPTIDGRLSREPYIAMVIVDKELDQSNGYEAGFLTGLIYYASAIQAAMSLDPKAGDSWLTRDISYQRVSAYTELEEGDWITLVAAVYRISWPKALYVRHFQFHRGEFLPYGHDEKTDYSAEVEELMKTIDSEI